MIAPSPRTTSFLGLCNNTSSPACDFETPLKGFESPQTLILHTATSTTPELEIFQGKTLVEDMRKLFRNKTLNTKEAPSSLSKKPNKNVLRVSFIYWEK